MDQVSFQTLLAYFFVLILIYVLFRLLYSPLRVVARVAYRTLLGAGILWTLNVIGGLLGYHIPLNVPTAMTAGLLGIPGIVVIFILQRLIS
ncbi:MAG: pro-sigmaK processing inhibitor BofA [Bacillota bacterium]|nr:MAG: pro-sigmaK processing inhibitor BofA [Bacillota bacterium]